MIDPKLSDPVVFADGGTQRSSLRAYVAIRTALREGTLDAASLNDRALSRSLGYTRSAVRSALTTLNNEGYIDRRRRIGTTFHDSPFDQTDDRAAVRSERADPAESVQIITLSTEKVPATPWMISVLGLHGELALLHECATMAGDEILSIQYNYYSAESGSIERFSRGLLATNDDALTTLSARFKALCGKDLGRVTTAIEAVACDGQVAERFSVPAGTPMLLREYHVIDVEGTTQVLSYSYSRGDRVTVRTETVYP